MPRDDAIDERVRRVEEIIDVLESGEVDLAEGQAFLAEGREQVDELRELLDLGEGEVEEL